jgi:4-hydroxymandelate oxidase
MHVSGPPVSGAGREPLVVTGFGRRVFDAASALASDPAHNARHGVYLTDLLAPYGHTPGPVDDGRGQSYGEMAAAVIAATVPRDEPVDLLVLAFAVPDIAPGRATATYLSHVCPGNPLAFAVADQGAATAFTALRLIREYACRSALLLVVEQADLHYQPHTPTALPDRHTAVALRFGQLDSHPASASGVPTISVPTIRQHADVAPEAVGPLLAAEVADLSAGHEDVTVVLGSLLAGVVGRPSGSRAAAVGQPYTGIWSELVDELAVTDRARRVLIADYDPQLRYLSLTATDVGVANRVAHPAGRPREEARAAC